MPLSEPVCQLMTGSCGRCPPMTWPWFGSVECSWCRRPFSTSNPSGSTASNGQTRRRSNASWEDRNTTSTPSYNSSTHSPTQDGRAKHNGNYPRRGTSHASYSPPKEYEEHSFYSQSSRRQSQSCSRLANGSYDGSTSSKNRACRSSTSDPVTVAVEASETVTHQGTTDSKLLRLVNQQGLFSCAQTSPLYFSRACSRRLHPKP